MALGIPLAAATALALPTAAASDGTSNSTPPIASSELKAFKLAAESGQRVEIMEQREESREVFANPDGTTTRRQYATPVWTRYERHWQEADDTLVRHPDGTVGPAAPVFGITFSGGGSAPMAAMAKNDIKFALSWPTALPEPTLAGNTATYKSVLPDVDLKLIAEVDGFAQHLIIHTPQAAANPALKRIQLGVTAQGVSLDDDAGDNLLAKDAAGNVIFSAPKPKMWEQPPTQADGTGASAASSPAGARFADAVDGEAPASATVAADVTGNTLTLTPDAELLAGADQFPLIVDPIFSGGSREKWAVVYSAEPSGTFPNGSGWNSSNPADEPRVGNNGDGRTRSFFQMNTGGLGGADILDATFAVRETHSWGCSASDAGPTELWSTNSLTTTPSWNTNNSWWTTKLDADSFAGGNATYCPGVLGHDFKSAALTSAVQQAADGGWSNLTLGLRAADTHEGSVNSFKRFENDPVLEVTYNFLPTVANQAAYEGSWVPSAEENKLVPCGGIIGNSGMALTAKLTDKDGGTITPQFSVTNTTTGAAVPVTNGAAVSSGKTATASVSAANLVSGSYKWKVRAKDGETTYSPYTADCAFNVDRQGPTAKVTITHTDGTPVGDPTVKYPARKTVRFKVSNPATDLAGFCWAADHPISVSSERCHAANWVPVASGATTATIDVIPTGYPNTALHVLAYDKAGNHSPLDNGVETTILATTKADFVYAAGQNPATGLARKDLHGDLTGDGYPDLFATDSNKQLLLYAGDGTGAIAAAQMVGTGGWDYALVAHGGDLAGFASTTAAPDGYEDTIARLRDGKLYLYPGNGLGTPWSWSRTELVHADLNSGTDWRRTRQILTPGDIDKNNTAGHAGGNDLITIECTTDIGANSYCANAELWLYTGNTLADGTTDQTEPFDLTNRTKIGSAGWQNLNVLAVGDQNDDGIMDIVTRDPAASTLYLYPGKITSGVYALTTRTSYAGQGWNLTNRPRLASAGNAQGAVTINTYTDPDDPTNPVTYRQFQPKTGEHYGDIWATTDADPNLVVNYVTASGTAATTTCPTGCLLFYPGGPTTHRSPTLVGAASWSTNITAIH
ncbi:VCBS repeat-containing protein [Streptomyces sp. NBC_01481]|uniref:FG-GAP repeat domain-containing protein n=1 Tax=Streptomyces sp. NBC_01481 TaxID=2975869 RepID=UPI00225395EE|nr:VCBS repeat-containing protein [Streptomyces sp. NBC_01481]MCX4586911.1 hypothetical protein [Streptomyces sp. NBC_01481]